MAVNQKKLKDKAIFALRAIIGWCVILFALMMCLVNGFNLFLITYLIILTLGVFILPNIKTFFKRQIDDLRQIVTDRPVEKQPIVEPVQAMQVDEDMKVENRPKNKSLRECLDCHKDVSVNATKCPHCGAPLPIKAKEADTRGRIILLIAIIFVSLTTYELFSRSIEANKARLANMTPQQKQEMKIKNQFSAYDGSHMALERYIKSTMNDPDSYEHISTKYNIAGDHTLLVTTIFRGKNAFGAMVVNKVVAYTGIVTGEVVRVVSQE